MSRRSRGNDAPIALFAFQDLITSLSGILIFLVLLLALDVALQVASGEDDQAKEALDIEALESLRETVSALQVEAETLRQAVQALNANDAVSAVHALTAAQREWVARTRDLEQTTVSLSKLQNTLGSERRKTELLEHKIKPLRQDLQRLRDAMTRAIEEKKVFFIPEKGTTKTPILVECSATGARVGFLDRAESPKVFPNSASGLQSFETSLAQYSTAREYFVLMIKPSAADYWQSLYAKVLAHDFDVGYDALEEENSIGFGEVRH